MRDKSKKRYNFFAILTIDLCSIRNEFFGTEFVSKREETIALATIPCIHTNIHVKYVRLKLYVQYAVANHWWL